jgi:hypothetical protein
MPTKNPRINVTLSPSVDDLVARMARGQRVSKSQVLRELLEAAEPYLQRAAALMDAASAATRGVATGLASQLGESHQRAEQELGKLLSNLDGVTADLVRQAEQVQGKRPAREGTPPRGGVPSSARPVLNPPASNRGVKSSRPRENQTSRRRKVAGS